MLCVSVWSFPPPLLFSVIVASLRLKRRLFEQVLLVRRMEEEKMIIVKEMTQHCQHLKKTLDKLDTLLRETKEDIKIHSMYDKCFLFNVQKYGDPTNQDVIVSCKYCFKKITILVSCLLFFMKCLIINVNVLHFLPEDPLESWPKRDTGALLLYLTQAAHSPAETCSITSTDGSVNTHPSFFSLEEDVEEESEDNCSPQLSEEEL